VGSRSLLNEADLAMIYHDVFTKLKIDGYELRINSRKILAALAEKCGGIDKMTDITIAIDKLDKIGMEKVKEELFSKNISDKNVDLIETYLKISGSNENKIAVLQSILDADTGIQELRFILDNTKNSKINLIIDFTLARGLNYYTGIIFEAKAPAHVQIGSIGGGGRYDDLTGLFGVPGVPGVGISFGVDRIYDVMEEMNLFPGELDISTTVLFFNEGDIGVVSQLADTIRNRNISCEVYPDNDKEEKQFKYAKRKKIPYIITSNANGTNYRIKNINTGDTSIVNAGEIAAFHYH
jgi:histidyl-tRNA synthetase